MSDMVLTRVITEAAVVADTFKIAGDWTALFTDGVRFRVTGSTANDGVYTCDGNSTFGAGSTTITVAEDITDATADGILEYWRDVAAVTNISGPALALDTEDVTAHDSPNGWEESVPTVLRTGEVGLDINYDPAEVTHDATDGLPMVMGTRRLNNFELVLPVPAPAGTVWAFNGYVTGFEPSAPHDGKLSASVTIKPSGEPTLL
jgi:hypothetical protein